MDNHLTQFATIIDAFGCETRYNSSDATISIVDVPSGQKGLVDKVLAEIELYDDTRNYVDGMAALCVADYIDDIVNPIAETSRLNIMEALGIMKDGRYIHQVLMLQKNNRSWHFSKIAGDCSHFGEECTHRGINPNPDRKGRRSTRNPSEYHVLNGKKEINREQLVTSSLEELFRSIPEDNLISAKSQTDITIDLRAFKKMNVEDQIKLIADLQEIAS